MGVTVWYCSECGDGPMGQWRPCCAICGHATCDACTVEYDDYPAKTTYSEDLEDPGSQRSNFERKGATAPIASSSEDVNELGRGEKLGGRATTKVLGLDGQNGLGEEDVRTGNKTPVGTVKLMSRINVNLSDKSSPPTNTLGTEKDQPNDSDLPQPSQRYLQHGARSSSGERLFEDHHVGQSVATQSTRLSQEETLHAVPETFIQPSSLRSHESSRPKHRPTQGDWVLIREMDPNRSDVENAVRQESFGSDTDSETIDGEEYQPEGVRKDALTELPRGSEQQERRPTHFRDANTRQYVVTEESDVKHSATLGADTIPLEDLSQNFNPPPSLTAVHLDSDVQPDADMTPRRLYAEDDEQMSAYAESVFSDDTIGSSATGMSAEGSYTEAEIVTATRELVEIFTKDPTMTQLYQLAFEDPRIGSERLKRNLYRLLKIYSQDLHREAPGELERLASQLVAVKSRYVTQCVMEKFFVKPPSSRHATAEDNDSEEEDIEDDDVPAIDEDRFEDIQVLRQFLVESDAFHAFKVHLLSFVRPKHLQGRVPIKIGAAEEARNPFTSKLSPEQQSDRELKDPDSVSPPKIPSWELVDIVRQVSDNFTEVLSTRHRRLFHLTERISRALLVRLGFLEPPLEPGLIRLRWQCACGDPLFGDVQEYRAGGVKKLIEKMERSIGSKVTATSFQEGTVNERYILAPMIWVRELVRCFTAFMRLADDDNMPVRHTDNEVIVGAESVAIEMPPVKDLLLLACMHQEQGGQALCQDRIGAIENDKDLFRFMRKQLTRTRTARWSLTQLKVVTGIHFTKFHLRLSDVEPRLHKPCCRPDACQCIPLFSNTEYDCAPAGPPEFGPPVLPQYMLHKFKHAEGIPKEEVSILNQIPKRNCGELRANGQVPADGWGLYYEEDWNIGLIIVAIAATSIFASFVFGICWTTMKADIQGAWGVSSYMITTCALVVALLSMIGRSRSE